MTGLNYILRKIQKCATMGARRLGDSAHQTPTGARKQLGLHGLTRQETPTRDTPRAARPNLAQVSVMPQVTQVETRLADEVNGPSRALGFFAAFLGHHAHNPLIPEPGSIGTPVLSTLAAAIPTREAA